MEKAYKMIPGATGEYTAKLVTTRAFKAGDLIADIPFHFAKDGEPYTYQTVQVGENRHIWLEDELVFMNHSCDPSTRWDLTAFKIYALRDIAEGGELTFFYPTSEWDMAQPFDCFCGASCCLGRIRGAKYIPSNVLQRYAGVAPHILALKRAQQP